MAIVDIECNQCGSNEYQLLDPKTGEIQCLFCRKRWLVKDFVQKTETEKFLEEQAKQPRIIRDNTTETDEQLMKMASGLMNVPGALSNLLGKVIKTFIMFIVVIVVIIVIVAALNFFVN